MKNLFVAAIIACGFFLVGAVLLVVRKANIKSAQFVLDNGPYCDAQVYAESRHGIADDRAEIIEHEIFLSAKPYEPLEHFLTITDGQTLHSILRPQGISEQEIAMLSLSLRPYLRA